MDAELFLKNEERAVFRLRELYRRHGYLPYKMSKFEEYDLYVRNKSFLVSDHILTFTDVDGKLMALKPDVTLSILKNCPGGPGLQKVYYHENVYRTSPASHGYREIMQAGLECIGTLDDYAVGEVVMLAARSLETISGQYLLDLSHLGVVAGILAAAALTEEERQAALTAWARKTPRPCGSCAGRAGCRRAQPGSWSSWPVSMVRRRRSYPFWSRWTCPPPRPRLWRS